MSTLSEDQIRSALLDLPGWEAAGGKITKVYAFPGFMDAVAFVNRVAEKAEAANHHPDLEIHYNKVVVSLVTHSAGGITSNDVDLAGQVESVATEE